MTRRSVVRFNIRRRHLRVGHAAGRLSGQCVSSGSTPHPKPVAALIEQAAPHAEDRATTTITEGY